ncbi:MAG: hypothetical protein AAFS10_24985, partial [Myxococcota bacterium]
RFQASNLEPAAYGQLGLCAPVDRDDWFLVSAATDAVLTVEIRYNTELTDIGLELRSADDTVLVTGEEQEGIGSSITYTVPEGGFFYVRTFVEAGVRTDYSLTYSREGAPFMPMACQDDDTEPNDTPLNAVTLELDRAFEGQICEQNADLFALVTEEAVAYRFELMVANADASLRMEIVAPDASTVLLVGPGPLEWRAPDINNYFVRVVGAPADRSAYLFSASVITLEPGACVDQFEPNNTPELAVPIAFGQIYEALNLCNGGTDQEDYFSVVVPEPGRLIASTFASVASMALDVRDVRGNVLGTSNLFGDTEEVSVDVGPGLYFVRPHLPFTFSAQGEYSLEVQFSPAPDCASDQGEPANNTIETAATVDGSVDGVICSEGDDVDIFGFEVSELGTPVSLRLTTPLAFGELLLEILDGSGEVLESASEGDEPGLLFLPQEVGTYYARISLESGETTAYNLSVLSVFCEDSFERNNNRFSTTPLLEGSTQLGELGLCPGQDDEDWFLISAEQDATIDVELVFDSAISNIDVELLDARAVRLVSGTEDVAGTEVLTATAEEAGFFFIRVFSNGNPNNYTLTYPLTGNGLMVPDC